MDKTKKGLIPLLSVLAICMIASVAAQPAPFLIYGWVNYSDATACDNPTVNITNTNTSKQWHAETNTGYNYYQLILANGTDVNATEKLQFEVTSPDGSQVNITAKHTVTQENTTNGGLFKFNITLEAPPAPNITSFSPTSPVNDTICTWRTFNVMVNQTVNVSWYLNESLLHTNVSVTEANYTLHAEFVGDNNVSAVATNTTTGLSDMQTWIWNVTAPADWIEGDVNGDGDVNSVDATWILQMVVGRRDKPASGTPEFVAADVNDDGVIDSTDATWILQYVVGRRPSL